MLPTPTDTLTLTPEQLRDRLAAWEARRRARLLEEATAQALEATVDAITGGWCVRSRRRPGYVEIVSAAGCTCAEFSVRRACPHQALIADMVTAPKRAERPTS